MLNGDVSVIIPSYNRLPHLPKALNSVFSQTLPPREVIVIDDGSGDGTWEWLQPQHQASLRVFRQERKGPASARNHGLAQAQGRFVAFLDSDDYWLPKKLETQVDFLTSHPEFKICQTEEIWIRNGVRVNSKEKHRKPSGDVFAACLKLCLISPSAVMIDRKFLADLGGFDESFPVCEDYELWLRAALRTPVQTLPEALTVKQGGHADQLSRAYPAMDRFRVQAMEKILGSEKLETPKREMLLQEIQNKLEILATGFAKHQPGEPNPYREKILWLQNSAAQMAAPFSESDRSNY